MPIVCTDNMIRPMWKAVRLNLMGDYYNKDGAVKPGSQLSLSTGVIGDDSKSKLYRIYLIGNCGVVYFIDFRDMKVYALRDGENTIYDTRTEAYMTAMFNAQGAAAIAKFEVSFMIGLTVGAGGFGALGIAAYSMASTADVAIRWGSAYGKISESVFNFMEARKDLKSIAPNLASMLDTMIVSAFGKQFPRALGDSVLDAFADPGYMACFIGSLLGGSLAEDFGVGLQAITKVLQYVVKAVFKQVLGAIMPAFGTSEKVLGVVTKSVTLGAQQAAKIAADIQRGLTMLASVGGTMTIVTGISATLLAAAIMEIAKNPTPVQKTMNKMLDALAAMPSLS